MGSTESSRESTTVFGSLQLTLSLDEEELVVGRSGYGRVHLRNIGQDLIEFECEQPIVAAVMNPSTLRQVGWYRGWIAGTGLLVHLEPGAVASIAVLVGTDSSRDGEDRLAPGEYFVSAAVSVMATRPDGDGYDRNQLELRAVPIRLVAR